MKILVIGAFALILHLVLGWPWTLLAGVAAGAWVGPRGWRLGALGVGLDWLLLVGYNYAVAARPVQAMAATLGAILGNLPGLAVVGLTLLVGLALGAAGGAAGTYLGLLVRGTPPSDASSL